MADSSLNCIQFALLKFHLEIGVVGVYSTRAGCLIIVGMCWDLGKLQPIIWVGCGKRDVWISEGFPYCRVERSWWLLWVYMVIRQLM